ncbi:MAG TPA: hypothetical protein VEH56_05520, partial [Candidatus Saccharimonadales bacterium]|nr:hypothetical protein [Candidatus Saccharimonadales bacterium]
PREAKTIFRKSIAPSIRTNARGQRFLERWVEVSGVMESTLAPIIDETIKKWPEVYIKSHPRGFEQASPQIEVHFSMTTSDPTRGARSIDDAIKYFKQQIRQPKSRRGSSHDPKS